MFRYFYIKDRKVTSGEVGGGGPLNEWRTAHARDSPLNLFAVIGSAIFNCFVISVAEVCFFVSLITGKLEYFFFQRTSLFYMLIDCREHDFHAWTFASPWDRLV